jgi:hypothetical protein
LVFTILLSVGVFAAPGDPAQVKELYAPGEIEARILSDKKLENFDDIDKNYKKVYTVKKSEFDIIKELKAKTDDELLSMGLDKDAIKNLRKADFKAKIKERARLDDKVLKGMGYSDAQIVTLRNFDGSDAQASAIGATLSISGYTGEYTYYSSTNMTKHQGIVTWEWDYCPFFTLTDVVAFSWWEGWHLSSDSFNKVYYVHSLGTRPEQYSVNRFTAVETIAAQNAFSVKGTFYYNLDYMYARRGTVSARIYTAGNVLNSNMMIKYGHREVVGTPSVNLRSGIDFGFNLGTIEQGSVLLQWPSEY